MSKISLIIPTLNESEIIPIFYRRLIRAMEKDFPTFTWEVIWIDDGSSDLTYKVLAKLRGRDRRVKALRLSRNFGHHIAITAGLDFAKGDYIVMMDGDLQDRPEDIHLLYARMLQGYDVVYGIRQDKQFDWLKRVTSSIFNWVIKSMVQEPIVINSTIFRIMTRQVAENLKVMRENNRYIVGMIGWVGFKHASQPVTHGKRYAGTSKYTIWKQFELAMNAVASFTDFPLKLASRLGFGMVILSLFMGSYIVYRKFAFDTPVVGWTSLFVSLLFISGIQTVILGFIGEYLGRVYLESKQRPLYIIADSIGL
jgi:polyisoprenyl-phosphate glycosyltransferase